MPGALSAQRLSVLVGGRAKRGLMALSLRDLLQAGVPQRLLALEVANAPDKTGFQPFRTRLGRDACNWLGAGLDALPQHLAHLVGKVDDGTADVSTLVARHHVGDSRADRARAAHRPLPGSIPGSTSP